MDRIPSTPDVRNADRIGRDVQLGPPMHFDEEAILAVLGDGRCIAVMREAMIALSAGRSLQLPRTLIDMEPQRIFATMAGALGSQDYFGAKLVSVFPDPRRLGKTFHRGLVVLFAAEDGRTLCTLDAGAITQIRTAAASAVATDVLCRRGSQVLALLGSGHQVLAHIGTISRIRDLRRIIVWGRSADNLARIADDADRQFGLKIEIELEAAAAVADADIVCTLTSASHPILHGAWLRAGTHVNLIGSSGLGSVEVDEALVASSRYIVESRDNAYRDASELIRAQASGAVGDDHIAAEIGEVLIGSAQGRQSDAQITVYKALGHVVQDLAAAAKVYEYHVGL